MLAFDFGTRKIGVAVGNTLVRVAHPLTTIRSEARASRFDAIVALIDEWRPQALVVGRPVHADGTPHARDRAVRRLCALARGTLRLPVLRVDERFTTQIADASLREAGMRGAARAEARDAMAAQLILQAWFDDNNSDATRDPA